MTTASPQMGESIEVISTPVLADFAELYERHYEAVFRAALRVTGNPADAQDVLQTVFLRVLSRSDDLEERQGVPGDREERQGVPGDREERQGVPGDREAARWPAAYFRRAAVNAAVDLLRRRAVHAETLYDDRAPHAAVEAPPLLKERLRRAVATLESEDATLFLLRHVEGLSIEELAGVFRLQKNNVAVRLHRIRLRLQAEMER